MKTKLLIAITLISSLAWSGFWGQNKKIRYSCDQGFTHTGKELPIQAFYYSEGGGYEMLDIPFEITVDGYDLNLYIGTPEKTLAIIVVPHYGTPELTLIPSSKYVTSHSHDYEKRLISTGIFHGSEKVFEGIVCNYKLK